MNHPGSAFINKSLLNFQVTDRLCTGYWWNQKIWIDKGVRVCSLVCIFTHWAPGYVRGNSTKGYLLLRLVHGTMKRYNVESFSNICEGAKVHRVFLHCVIKCLENTWGNGSVVKVKKKTISRVHKFIWRKKKDIFLSNTI